MGQDFAGNTAFENADVPVAFTSKKGIALVSPSIIKT